MMIVSKRSSRSAPARKDDNSHPPSKRRGSSSKKARRAFNKGRWSDEEKLLFLVGLRKYGKGRWKQIGRVLTTRYVLSRRFRT